MFISKKYVLNLALYNSGQTLQFFSNKRLKSTKNSEFILIQFQIVGKMFNYLVL